MNSYSWWINFTNSQVLCKSDTVDSQVLDPTSRQQQVAVSRIGPVPVAIVKRMSVEVMEKKATAARVKGGRVGSGEGV